jgi:hypothetical protein
MLWSFVDRYQCFGQTRCLHLQVASEVLSKGNSDLNRIILIPRGLQTQPSLCLYLCHIFSMIRLLFYPEDGGSILIQNVRKYLPDYTVSSYCHDNINFMNIKLWIIYILYEYFVNKADNSMNFAAGRIINCRTRHNSLCRDRKKH